MQNKGLIKFIAIVLAVACAYQLSFTVVSSRVESKAEKSAQTLAIDSERLAELAAGGVSEGKYRETVREQILDSMKSVPVYNILVNKFTYSEVKERELNLGLDLRGGMNVMLEIAVEDIVVALSNNSQDPAFLAAIQEAKAITKKEGGDYIQHFEVAYAKHSNGAPLATIFANQKMAGKVKSTSTNAEIITILKADAESAIENAYQVIRTRIDRFGVAQPNVQRLDNSGRILVELPGVKDPERVRKLLQGTASLEFWATYDGSEIVPQLEAANLELGKAAAEVAADADEAAQLAAAKEQNPLLAVLQLSYNRGPVVGYAASYNMAEVERLLASDKVRALLNPDVRFMWGAKAIDEAETIYELYAIKADTRDGQAPLDGGSVTDAAPQYSQTGSAAEVDMVMDAHGTNVWARMTRDNIGKSIAIVLDNLVYSAPTVQNEISGGRSAITGNFTINEATDLANVLKSGKLPAPARIIQDTVVGPSLGAESINASLISFVIAFILVLIYMIFFYSTAGVVASVALVCNVFYIFGILASFGAVLTLPGIAGIVLTLGMAVDANVIIYERVKEGLWAGKPISTAVDEGYKNAMSAIIDSNITTIITGIVLFIFGTGPVQGFATTLIIVILTSLFTSLFFTRMMFASRIAKGKNVKFSTKITDKFLANTKINFIGIRKVSYVFSLILVVVSAISLSTRGLNYGVDFSGGRTYVVRFDNNVTADAVREGLQEVFDAAEGNANEKSFEVKKFGEDNQMRIVTQYMHDRQEKADSRIVDSLVYEGVKGLYTEALTLDEFTSTDVNPNGIIQADMVGPSVAKDITRGAFISVAIALLAIGLYIVVRFKKWQWGVGSVVALMHDAFLTLGIFSLLHGVLPFNLEIDQSFIAAILTIIGYSINDKVVIFDRIREFTTLYPKRNMKETINAAVNTTLARTVNTSGTTFVTLLAIFLFGGAVIRGFVFALMFGVIIGTLSSIFIATPVAYDLMSKKVRK